VGASFDAKMPKTHPLFPVTKVLSTYFGALISGGKFFYRALGAANSSPAAQHPRDAQQKGSNIMEVTFGE